MVVLRALEYRKTLLRDKIPPLSTLIGYEKERQILIEEFFVPKDKNRLYSITGCPGVGKSTLARHTINFIQERKFFEGGCIYVDCNNIKEYSVFLRSLIEKIQND